MQGDEVDESNETLTLTLSDAGGDRGAGHGEDYDPGRSPTTTHAGWSCHRRAVTVAEDTTATPTAKFTLALRTQPTTAIAVEVSSECGWDGDGEPSDAELHDDELEDNTDGDGPPPWMTTWTTRLSGRRRSRTVRCGGDYGDQSKNVAVTVSEDEGTSAFALSVRRGCTKQHGDGESEVHG